MAPFEADPAPDVLAQQTVCEDEPVAGTGVAEVDAVLASLRQLDELPVEEHVAVFEEAHEALRRVLDGARAHRATSAPEG